jgi:hypothetical protein
MTGINLSGFEAASGSPAGPAADEDVLLRNLIAYHLRHCGIESVAAGDFLRTPPSSRKISRAIFHSLKPRQLRLFIADARVSIALALQRHSSNEQYRRRLAAAPHYRALRQHLSESFREMMVPPSNWSGYRFSASRGPILALAYQNEIERIEMELLVAPEHSSVLGV